MKSNEIIFEETKINKFILSTILVEIICFFIFYIVSALTDFPNIYLILILVIFGLILLLPLGKENIIQKIKKIYLFSKENKKTEFINPSFIEEIPINNNLYTVFWEKNLLITYLKFSPESSLTISNSSNLQKLDFNILINNLVKYDVTLESIDLFSEFYKNKSLKNKITPVEYQKSFLVLKLDPNKNKTAIKRHGKGILAAQKTLAFVAARIQDELKNSGIWFNGMNYAEVQTKNNEINNIINTDIKETWKNISFNKTNKSIYTLKPNSHNSNIFNRIRNEAVGDVSFRIGLKGDKKNIHFSTLITLQENDKNKTFNELILLNSKQYSYFQQSVNMSTPFITNLSQKINLKNLSTKFTIEANGAIIGINEKKQLLGLNYQPMSRNEILVNNNLNLFKQLIFNLIKQEHKIIIIDNNPEIWKTLLVSVNNPSFLSFVSTSKIPDKRVLQLFDTIVVSESNSEIVTEWYSTKLIYSNSDSVEVPLIENYPKLFLDSISNTSTNLPNTILKTNNIYEKIFTK